MILCDFFSVDTFSLFHRELQFMLLFFNFTPKCSHVNVVAQRGVIKPEAPTGTKVTKLALMTNLNFSLGVSTLNFVDIEAPFVNLLTGNSELRPRPHPHPPTPPLPTPLTLFNQGWSLQTRLIALCLPQQGIIKDYRR